MQAPGPEGHDLDIAGILFDKDGTLFEFEASWTGWVEGIVHELSGGAPDRLETLAGALRFDLGAGRLQPDSPVIAGTVEEICAAISPVLPGVPEKALVRRLNAAAAAAPMVPAVPLEPLLSGLRASGLRLGVATNATETEAMAHLRAAGIDAAFDFVAGFDTGHGAKPGPGMCRAFAEAMDLDPAAVLMVGDSLHDLHAGRAAGMRVIAVLTGIASAADLAPHADAVLPDIGHLPAWLGNTSGAGQPGDAVAPG